MRTFGLKLLAILCLSCTVFTANAAKDLYVSATGNDSNDGLTPETPIKTLGKAHDLVGIGDIIHIEGIIDISQEKPGGEPGTNVQQTGGKGGNGGFFIKAERWNNVKMVGKDAEKDGFTGANDSRIFKMEGGTYYFENLLFTGGADIVNDGGNALRLINAKTTFTGCRFEENKAVSNPEDATKFIYTNGWGGVFHINGGVTNLVNCYLADNANTLGGAFFIIKGDVSLSGCTFEDHNMSAIGGSTGGTMYLWVNDDQNVTIDRCVFQGNLSRDGGAIALSNRTDRENKKLVLKILNSSFVKNEAVNNGGAFYHNNTRVGTIDTITVANTTFFGNRAERFGGAIYLGVSQPKSIFTMVNSSVIANYTMGNGGFCGGLVSHPDVSSYNMLKRIYNCIFDKNRSLTQNIFSDMRFRAEPTENAEGEKELIIKNTFMGFSIDGLSSPGFLTNDKYPGNNLNYCRPQLEGEGPEDVYENAAGIDDDPEYYLDPSLGQYYYAVGLKDDAPARTFGNVEYLTEFEISESDQFGKERVIKATACVAGATEATLEEIEDDKFSDYPVIGGGPSGIHDGTIHDSEYKIFLADGIVSVAGVTENVSLKLYNISGNILRSGFNQLSVSDLPRGIYIVKASVGGKSTAVKVVK